MASSEETRIPISLLDYIPPLNYVRIVFPLPLKPGVDYKAVFNDLHEALHKTFVQEPWASGKVFRSSAAVDDVTPGWRPGQLEMRFHPSYSPDAPRPYQLRYHELVDTDWTYADLRDSGFPSVVFPEKEEEFLLDAPRLGDVDNAGAEIFLAQANFLPGGLLLAMTVCHAAMDGSGMIALMQMWAENFRELRGRYAGNRIAPSRFTPADRDRTIADRFWERENSEGGVVPSNCNSPDDPWLRGLVCLDSNHPGEKDVSSNGKNSNGSVQPPRQPSRVMLNRVMFLSKLDLAALQKECAAEASSSLLSLSDAICALLWRGVMRARAAAALARSTPLVDETSVIEAPVDVRSVFPPDFPPNYLGNCWLVNTGRMPLAELIAPATPLGRIAQAVRQGAARLDAQAVHDAYGLLRTAPNLSRVQGRFVERLDSSDFLVSNMITFPIREINFGDRYFGKGGVPQSMRVLHAQYADGVRLGHVLPRNANHGGVELSVNLFDDEMAFLDADDQFNRYAVAIG